MYGNNPYFPQMQMQMPYMQTAQQAPKHQVLRLKNESAVWAQTQQLQPDSSDIYLRDDGQLIWLAVSDESGNVSVAAFDITPHQDPPAPDYTVLEDRITKLEGLINGITENLANVKQTESSSEVSANKTVKRYDSYGQDRQGPFQNNGRNDK
jgi:hypothetical protein